MEKPKIGILGFSDGEPEVHEQLKKIVQIQLDSISSQLQQSGLFEVVIGDQLINSVESAKIESRKMVAQGVCGTIFSYGVFSYPNFSVVAAKNGQGPFLLAANLNPEWPGMVAMLASGGALDQMGIDHFRVAGDINDESVMRKVTAFIKCAYVVNSLHGQKYGLIGGRSLGMYSATVNMLEWQQKFGIDIEHVDQSEIVRIATTISDDKVEKAYKWLNDLIGQIHYDNKRLTESKLKEQIRHYEATKQLIFNHGFDFIGVKCHYEMSRQYCTQCMSAAFINDPYDWDGPKEPFVFACEADGDAALTMQILKLLTGDPVLFMDVRHYDSDYNVMVFCNCGSQSTYYARQSLDPKENLAHVSLFPCLEIYSGGGAHFCSMAKEGEATIARLTRKRGRYLMTLIPAQFVTLPANKMAETTAEWPHVYARLPFNHEIFLERFGANHCHAVYGNHIEHLSMICKMLDIDIEQYS